MDTQLNMTRREFLKTSATLGAGLTLAFYLPAALSTVSKAASDATLMPNAFIRIGTDNRVTVIVKHLEPKQVVYWL